MTLPKQKQDANEQMYHDAIIWVYFNQNNSISQDEFFNWLNSHPVIKNVFQHEYDGVNGVNKVKEAILSVERIEIVAREIKSTCEAIAQKNDIDFAQEIRTAIDKKLQF